MTNAIPRTTIALLVGTVLGLLLATSVKEVASQGQGYPQNLSSHHQEIQFSLAPGESHTFPLPRTDFPVNITVGTSSITVRDEEGNETSQPAVIEIIGLVDSVAGTHIITAPAGDQFSICVPTSEQHACAGIGVGVDAGPFPHTGTVFVEIFFDGGEVTNSSIDFYVSMWY